MCLKKFFNLIKNLKLFCCLAITLVSLTATNSYALFENLGCSARAVGFNNVFVGFADDVFTVYYNPAGLGQLVNTEFGATIANLHQGLTDNSKLAINYYGAAFPIKIQKYELGGLGVGYYIFDANPLYQESAMLFSYGKDLAPIIKLPVFIGASYKMLSLKYGQDEYTEFNPVFTEAGYTKSDSSFDIGCLYAFNKESMFGLNIANLTQPNMGLVNINQLPMQIRTGVSYHRADTIFGLDLSYANSVNINLGAEKWFLRNTLAVRGGLGLGSQDYKVVSLGASYFILIGPGKLGIDYAFVYPLSGLKVAMGTHWFSVRWSFGKATKELRRLQLDANAEFGYISPDSGDARSKVNFNLMSNIVELNSWEFVIKKADNTIIKTYRGAGVLLSQLTWDGKDDNNMPLPEGKYLYALKIQDPSGAHAETVDKEIVIDTQTPKCSFTVSTTAFSPNGDGVDDYVTLTFTAQDNNAIDSWLFKILDSKNVVVKTIKGELSPPAKLDWDGKDDYYQQIVHNGIFVCKFTVWDKAENKSAAEDVNLTVDVPVPVKEIIQIKEVVREIIKEVPKDVTIKEEKEGLRLSLASSILFDAGKYTLRIEAYNVLDQIIKLLEAYPENNVRIEGHTDAVGSNSFNQVLSEMRARSVYDYLAKHGVDMKRLKAVGYGSRKPMATNSTNEGRTQNRRVEIIIIGATK